MNLVAVEFYRSMGAAVLEDSMPMEMRGLDCG